MTSGEIASLVTVIGSFLTILGITGIDSGMISSLVNGIIAFVTIVTAVWAFVQHRKAVKNAQ